MPQMRYGATCTRLQVALCMAAYCLDHIQSNDLDDLDIGDLSVTITVRQ